MLSVSSLPAEALVVTKKQVKIQGDRVSEMHSFPEIVHLPTTNDHLLLVEHSGCQKVVVPLKRTGIASRAMAIALPGGLLIHGLDRILGSYYTFLKKEICVVCKASQEEDTHISFLLAPFRFVMKHSYCE